MTTTPHPIIVNQCDDSRTVVIPDQPPEIFLSVVQWQLSYDEAMAAAVTLQITDTFKYSNINKLLNNAPGHKQHETFVLIST